MPRGRVPSRYGGGSRASGSPASGKPPRGSPPPPRAQKLRPTGAGRASRWGGAAAAVPAPPPRGLGRAPRRRPGRRTRVLLGADLVVTAGLLLSTQVLQYPDATVRGALPVTATWMAGPVLAWAVRYGRRAGTIAALIVTCCDFAVQHGAA